MSPNHHRNIGARGKRGRVRLWYRLGNRVRMSFEALWAWLAHCVAPTLGILLLLAACTVPALLLQRCCSAVTTATDRDR